jgi:hypothetical protein
MKFRCCVVAVSAALSGQAAATSWNPYAKPADRFEEYLQAAAFGTPGADRALEDALAADLEIAPERSLQGYHQLCIDYGMLTWDRARVAACDKYARAKQAAGKIESGDDDVGMANAFADQPPIRAIGSARVPLSWNAFGSQNVDVAVNGVRSSWFFDTGAQITVVIQSLADRMHIRPVGTAIKVGTTTADVTGKVGIIDRLQIGSAFVENVPVLILSDQQLKLGNVHQIEGILGLQVMAAFGRIAWVDGGRNVALGELAPKPGPNAAPIYWHEEGVGVPVRTTRGTVGAILDTGDNATNWRPAGTELLDPKLLTSAEEHKAHVGGAGGVIEVTQRALPEVNFKLGSAPIVLQHVSMVTEDKAGAAQVGMDAVSQFSTFILDFDQMRMDGRLKTAPERNKNRQPTMSPEDVKVDTKKSNAQTN